MMSVEGPFLSAVIARMAEPKFNLAAYGVAFSFALIIEAPVIMMMSASTALVEDKSTFKKLRNFTYITNAAITGVMLFFIIPQVFYFVAEDLINLPHEVAELTHIATIILLPWPGAIGYRRFYQGILIRGDLTKRVAYGTVIRLVSMSGTAILLYSFSSFDGVVVGAAALSAGVIAEGAASKIMALSILRKMKDLRKELSYRGIYDFYYPLALTSLLSLGVHPLITFFVGQSAMPLESLAVLPVINSLVFIFRSLGLSFQEVGIAMMGENMEGYNKLKQFSFIGGTAVVLLLSAIAFTPLSQVWFFNVSGLSKELAEFAIIPLMIMAIMPGLTYWISFQRSLLVHSRKTQPITIATAIEVTGICLVMFISIKYFAAVGAIAAASAFIIGRLGANLYLHFPFMKIVKSSTVN